MTNAVRLMLVVGMLLLAATTRPVPVFAAESPAAGTPFGPAKTAPLPVVTAREIFEQLPSSIFDNTAEGLPDEEKDRLLETGQCEFWEIVGETDDVIAFRALPFRDSAVALRLFRNEENGEILAAIGTLGVPICALEATKMKGCDGIGAALPGAWRPQGAGAVLGPHRHGASARGPGHRLALDGTFL